MHGAGRSSVFIRVVDVHRQIQGEGYDVEKYAKHSFYEAMRDGQMAHLALPKVGRGPLSTPVFMFLFCFHRRQDVAQVSDHLRVVSVDL